MNKSRPKQMIFRVNEKEKEQILKKVKRSKLNQNEYLLKCALDKEIHVIDGLHDMTIELKRIGNNLNQLTRAVNEGQANCSEELESIKGELSETWQSLRSLIQRQV
ncbi:plasmid mobilization protein [Clostridium botulinum]|uniref:plasmid mobilization protein n=1 Tax=Clostridium botulinum TaxID=1491 RepID=UPI0039659C42